jgi:hypothetical protein
MILTKFYVDDDDESSTMKTVGPTQARTTIASNDDTRSDHWQGLETTRLEPR